MDDPNTKSKSMAATPGQRKRADELVALAIEEFGELEGGEELVLRSAAFGGEANFPNPRVLWDWEKLAYGNEPWIDWDSRGNVRSKLIEWVCTNTDVNNSISHVGVCIKGARIVGIIDLQAAVIPFPLAICNSAIPEGIRLFDAQLPALHLDASCVSGLDADRIRVGGAVHLRNGFCSFGEVRFSGARIGGNFSCRGALMGKFGGHGLELAGCRIQGTLYLDFAEFHAGVISLGAAEVSLLIDKISTLPELMSLTQFTYGGIHPDSIGQYPERIEWLAKHDETVQRKGQRFDPQPYRQLAKVLRQSGHEAFASEIMFVASKKQARAQLGRLKKLDRWWGNKIFYVWYWLLEHIIGYGYRRWLPLVWMLGFFAFGAFVFSDYDPKDLVWFYSDPYPGGMQPTQAKAAEAAVNGASWLEGYPVFRPIAYSMDTFLPLVDLHQESYWTPRDGWVKRFYLPFHILMGWVVTTLAAVSITGLVRHEKE